MDWPQFLSTDMPKATTIAAAAISVIGAIGTAMLSYLSSESLERTRATLQQDLEGRKAELQTELEGRKLALQKELEEFKANVADELAAQNARRAHGAAFNI
jgi:hypothetical protein